MRRTVAHTSGSAPAPNPVTHKGKNRPVFYGIVPRDAHRDRSGAIL